MPNQPIPGRDPSQTGTPSGGSSPYGPHRDGVDESSGGADSSPFEADESGTTDRAARQPQERGSSGNHPPDPTKLSIPPGQTDPADQEGG